METVKTVLWGMIGIRRKADHERANVKPIHLIVLAVIFVVLFVLTLRFVVSLVVN
jgi:cell division protein FtsB